MLKKKHFLFLRNGCLLVAALILCAALIAGICIDQRNPEALLSIGTTAADLMDRMEESPNED